MRLYLNDTSPFARLVLATALEVQTPDFDLVWVDPWKSPPELVAINPFSTVPTLHVSNDQTLYESLLICEYLIAHSPMNTSALRLFYPQDENALERLALGKNLMEFAFRKVVMQRFMPDLSNNVLFDRIHDSLMRSLNHLEVILKNKNNNSANQSGADSYYHFDFPSLCLAIALDYIKFRLKDLFENFITHNIHYQTVIFIESWQNRLSLKKTTPNQLQLHPIRFMNLLA